jgi:hypothetical protein
MSIILSLANGHGGLWAAGPDGLYRVTEEGLTQTPQPQQNLYCCCAIHDRVLVGGLPHGVAFSMQAGENWQAGWMDDVDAPVVTLAPDPQVELTGVILAGTDGGGILRTVNRGNHWYTRNFGLRSFNVLALAWAPPPPADLWPRWLMAYACTEEGIYHSPNGGRGWKRSECPDAVYQCVAVSPQFHADHTVLAGTEANGLWRSTDGGHTFAQVEGAPAQVNALIVTSAGGWVLSDAEHVWHSPDGVAWQPLNERGALALLSDRQTLWMGTDEGVTSLELTAEVAVV